jgi:branched-chain amino acid transport system ATP-binding protein
MKDVIIHAENLYGGYQGEDVLKGITITVNKGESVAIIGPNGAGKSTLLRALYGMVKVREGTITFEGQRVERLKPLERLDLGMAISLQGRCNFPAMTVQENLEMGGVRLPKTQLNDEIERVIDIFPVLGKKKRQRAGTMSGGEQQQLEMAMALMMHPRLFLIDEPSLGLDLKNFETVFEIITGLKDQGISVLLVEQNAVRALESTDRAYVLEQGKIVMTGPSGEILVNPDVKELYLGGGDRELS